MQNGISSELLEKLQQKSDADGSSGNAWACYAILLRYMNEAIRRTPSPEALDACSDDDIDLILGAELEHLASTVVEIFPVRGPDELFYYMKIPEMCSNSKSDVSDVVSVQ